MRFTDKNFEEHVLKADIPVLVDFWASWCLPCKAEDPILDKLEKEYAGKLKIGKLNVDRNPRIRAKYHIQGVPTYIIFRNGEIIHRDVAAKSEKQLREMIEKALHPPKNDKEVVKEEPEKAYTPEEEEEIKKKLRSLGYL